MSESDIDMDRCLLGIDDEKACVPEITWTNCAEQMPPDEMVVIVDHKDKFDIHRGCELWAQVVVYGDPHNYKYTEFTPEKWEVYDIIAEEEEATQILNVVAESIVQYKRKSAKV